MSLHDPFFTKFDGSPDVGRVPVRLTVTGGGELTGSQLRGVEQAYQQFRNACRLSASNFHTELIKLGDGTKIWFWSLQGRDEVTVEPSDGEDGGRLPHGFVVTTNWQTPLFYCRDLNDGVQWVIAGDPVLQIEALASGIYDNQVFRKAGDAYFNLPHVYDSTLHSIWDYGPDGGLTGGPAGFTTPFRIKNNVTGELTFEPAHYAAQNLILDADATTLYTVADEAPILLPEADGYPDPITYFPGVTDAAGNQLAMNAWRYAVLSPTANIWKFRLWNERIKRIGDTSYEAIERNAQDIITPWSKQTTVVTSINDSNIGEDPDDLLYAVGMWLQTVDGVGAVGGSGWLPDIGITASWVTGFADGELDISGVPRRNSYLQAIRHISAQATGSATLSKVLASGAHDEVVYIDILKELNYPAEILWRGGEAGVGYFTSDIFGDAFSGDGYGTSHAVIKRKDTKYNVDGTPRITAKLGWKDLLLLEGTTEGRMNGKVYENVETIYGKFQNYMDRTFITRETYNTIVGTPGYVANLGTWLTAHNIRNTYYEDLRLAHGVLPFSGPNPTTKYTTLENLRPSNTVSYTLTSRYVIDYDHKGRFYAAIRCEVTCSGARWDENTAVYEGFMAQTSAPSYAVKIWFESDWNGVFAQQLLVEESVTRPGFEIITISKFSPWYWPFPAYIDRDCKARVPPEPVPDENFMMMFKNLASHQGANTNLCCADVRPDITGGDVALTQSKDGIEYSYLDNGAVIPHDKYVTGQLYARTFKLSDISESLWMLKQLKVDAVEDNFQPIDGPEKPTWFYHPIIKAALDVQRHIEVRDGVIVQWSDNIPGETSGYPPTPAAPPAATSRSIKLYRV